MSMLRKSLKMTDDMTPMQLVKFILAPYQPLRYVKGTSQAIEACKEGQVLAQLNPGNMLSNSAVPLYAVFWNKDAASAWLELVAGYFFMDPVMKSVGHFDLVITLFHPDDSNYWKKRGAIPVYYPIMTPETSNTPGKDT